METAKIGIVGVVGSGNHGKRYRPGFAQAGYLVTPVGRFARIFFERALKKIEKSLDSILCRREASLYRIAMRP